MVDKPKRLLMHIPHGVIIAWMLVTVSWLGVMFALYFYWYESNEDWHINDQAWYDVKGALWGLFLGWVSILIWRLKCGQ